MHGSPNYDIAPHGTSAGVAGGFRLSLVIPAWNEEKTIGQAIREADAALSAAASEYEILVVDDGSTDGTAEAVRAAAGANPRVRLLRHPRNLGYGAALRTGFEAAALDLVAFTDADCQFDLADLAYMLPLTRRFDVTCGYRIDRQDPALRRFCSWGYNALVTLLAGSQVRDIDCALKVFRREKLAAILPECAGFFVNTEMLARARLGGLSVVEVGVRHRPRAAGQSKVSLRDVPRTLSSLLPFWWSRLLFPAPDAPTSWRGGQLWAALMTLAVLAGCLLFPNLSYPLMEPDEGRYAEISREMLAHGDGVIPTLNQRPYYDKPPLLYWLVAGSLRCFGGSEWAARLTPALAALGAVLATFLCGNRTVGGRGAFLGALALTLTPAFIQCGRFLILDGLLTVLVAAALFAGHAAIAGSRLRWPWWVASAACCGLGVLTKGPVALALVAPPLAAYAWLNRLPARPTARHWAAYAALALGLAAPWYVAFMCRDPRFAYHFFVEHHLHRFFGEEYHGQPFWFYAPVLLVLCLPWSLLLLPRARSLFARPAAPRAPRPRALGFYLLWAGWCVLFFSLSRGKLPPYVLPAAPALALLFGCWLDRGLSQAGGATSSLEGAGAVPRRAAMLFAAAWLVVSVAGWRLQLLGPAAALAQAAMGAAAVAGVALWGRRLSARAAWVLCGVLGVAVIHESAHDLVPAWSARRSPLARSEAVTRLVREARVPVACYGGDWGSVPFYAGSTEAVPSFCEYSPPGEVRKFLSRHPRCLFVIRYRQDREAFRAALPPGMRATTVVDVGEALAVLVQDARGQGGEPWGEDCE